MKEVHDGKLYDTKTADEICDVSPAGYSRTDHAWHETQLYRTKNGRFFLAERGGPRSLWAESLGNNGWSGGSGIKPITASEAREYAERYADVETIAQYFEVDDA